jgi:hypothetical protein
MLKSHLQPSDRATVGWALSMPKMIAAFMSFSRWVDCTRMADRNVYADGTFEPVLSVPPTLVSQFRWSTSDSGHATQFNTALHSNTPGMGKYKWVTFHITSQLADTFAGTCHHFASYRRAASLLISERTDCATCMVYLLFTVLKIKQSFSHHHELAQSNT